MAGGQALPGLGVLADEAAVRPCVEDLDALGALLVVLLRGLLNLLEAGDPLLGHLRDRVRIAVDAVKLAGLSGVALLDPELKVVQDVDLVVAEDAQGPSHPRRAEDAQLLRVVDDDRIVLTNPELAHGLGELPRARQHVRVRAVLVDDLVEVEEAGPRDALLAIDIDALSRVVRQEPGGA